MPIFTKKGITTGLLVSIIGAVVVLTVILILITPRITQILIETGEQAQCQFSLLLSKTAETVTFGFGEIPVECKTTRKTITTADIERLKTIAKDSTLSYSNANIPASEIYTNNEDGHYKWAASKIISDELVSCYDRGWQGQLNYGQSNIFKVLTGERKFDYVCILCTRLTFDPKVTEKLPKFNRSDGYPAWVQIKNWLENNNYRGQTYYDYLTSDDDLLSLQNKKKSLEASYFDPKKSLAVLFLADVYGRGTVHLANYEDLTIGFGWEQVYDAESPTKLRFPRCATIIGD